MNRTTTVDFYSTVAPWGDVVVEMELSAGGPAVVGVWTPNGLSLLDSLSPGEIARFVSESQAASTAKHGAEKDHI